MNMIINIKQNFNKLYDVNNKTGEAFQNANMRRSYLPHDRCYVS